MKYAKVTAIAISIALFSGCATLPTGPSVRVLPSQGKSFETFRSEDAQCRQWAEEQNGQTPQRTYERNTATGAVAGTAIGAGIGAVLGAASGHPGAGAAIGGASGLLVGTAAGSSSGGVYGREAQQRYDNAYVACMYSYGNQVPGYRKISSPPPPAVVVEEESGEEYPPPPEVYVEDAPRFIYSPVLGMYVAVGVPYDLVYSGRDYFYFHGGSWYRGPYYNGPWVRIPRRAYPSAFYRYRIDNIRHYRDLEYRRWERDRGHYGGRFHLPEVRGRHR